LTGGEVAPDQRVLDLLDDPLVRADGLHRLELRPLRHQPILSPRIA
jgi:hypothetical protein